jgi:hypothetical protein
MQANLLATPATASSKIPKPLQVIPGGAARKVCWYEIERGDQPVSLISSLLFF